MTPCQDPNDGGALPGLGESAYWSRERKRLEVGERKEKKTMRDMEKWQRTNAKGLK